MSSVITLTGDGKSNIKFNNETFRKKVDLRDWNVAEFYDCDFVGDPDDLNNLFSSRGVNRLILSGGSASNFPLDAIKINQDHGRVVIDGMTITKPFNNAYTGNHQDGIQVTPDIGGVGFIGELEIANLVMDYSEAQWFSSNGIQNPGFYHPQVYQQPGINNFHPQNILIKTNDNDQPRIGNLIMHDLILHAWHKIGISLEGISRLDIDSESIEIHKLGGSEYLDPSLHGRRTPWNSDWPTGNQPETFIEGIIPPGNEAVIPS